MTATELDSDLEILNEILDQESLPCSYEQCENEATHLLQCAACGVGKETLCSPHAVELRQAGEWVTITFNETCGHTPFIVECPLLPI